MRLPLATVPLNLGDWTGHDLPVEAEIIEQAQTTEYLSRTYESTQHPGLNLQLWINYSRQGNNLRHTPEICLPSGGWNKIESQTRILSVPAGHDRSLTITQLGYGRDELVEQVGFWYYIFGEGKLENYVRSLPITSRSSHGRTTRGSSMTVEVFYHGELDPDGEVLRDFARELLKGLEDILPLEARRLSHPLNATVGKPPVESRKIEAEMKLQRSGTGVMVACPDARSPAYQAVIGLHRVAKLHSFVTATYFNPAARLPSICRRLAPARFGRLERILQRRHDPEIPPALVHDAPSFDLLLRLEARLEERLPHLNRALAQYRTTRFDAQLARAIARDRPELLLAFSDVGSRAALPLCRRLGIKTIVSMVHGDVREEQAVLEQEAVSSPEFMPIYLGSSNLDRVLLTWLHDRRLRDLALADRVLVPSQHIAETLVRYGTPAGKVRVIPYAADCHRFCPPIAKHHGSECTFLFAGGISHRKGIKYLLEAWRRIHRPGWRLQLLGPLPANLDPLKPYLDLVEPLGRVSQSEMPARMASADVFVFPSLFEGSAVVTYEALATGLPSVVTPSAGSVVRDGIEGFIVSPSQVDDLARRMEQLGNDPGLRARMARAAPTRALSFDWPRYHERLIAAVDDLLYPELAPPLQAHSHEHNGDIAQHPLLPVKQILFLPR